MTILKIQIIISNHMMHKNIITMDWLIKLLGFLKCNFFCINIFFHELSCLSGYFVRMCLHKHKETPVHTHTDPHTHPTMGLES